MHHPMRALNIIGELINNSYARARAGLTTERNRRRLRPPREGAGGSRCAQYLTLNLDGTARIQVRMAEMLALLPAVIPAIQAVTSVPLSFDNPSIEYHKVALKLYDRNEERTSPSSIRSRPRARSLDEMIQLVKDYDTKVVVMASEHFVPGGTAPVHEPRRMLTPRRSTSSSCLSRRPTAPSTRSSSIRASRPSAPTPTASSTSVSTPCA